MLTKRENFLETINGGNPERYVDNFEYLTLVFDCITMHLSPEIKVGEIYQNAWGVYHLLAPGEPGVMPLTDEEHRLVTDVCEWRNQINTPQLIFSEEEWKPIVDQVNAIDRNETFVAPFLVNGIFEKLHYFMGMEDAMANFYEEPEAMHDLIDYISDWEIKQGEEIVKYIRPDAIFHHDDWGTQRSSFLSPEMFDEFIVPAYAKIYGFWKENGIEVLVHHSDSYAANLLPYFKKMHIDVWQGAIKENDIPKCIAEFDQHGVAIMGGLNNGVYDKPDTTPDQIEAGFRELLDSCPNQGKHYLIPGLTMGEPGTIYDNIYPMASEVLNKLSKEYF